MFLTIHHTLVDTVSWGVLLEDLATCCLALERGESPSLPAKTSSFQTLREHRLVYARSHALREEILLDHSEDGRAASGRSRRG